MSAREKVLAELRDSMDSFGKQGTGTGLVPTPAFGRDDDPTLNKHEPPSDRVRAIMYRVTSTC
jgi:hypothetical protein